LPAPLAGGEFEKGSLSLDHWCRAEDGREAGAAAHALDEIERAKAHHIAVPVLQHEDSVDVSAPLRPWRPQPVAETQSAHPGHAATIGASAAEQIRLGHRDLEPRLPRCHGNFRKIFGPFANFWRPQTIFFGDDAADLHAHVTALVRDFDSAYWNVFISANHADAALEAVMARSRSELTATENP